MEQFGSNASPAGGAPESARKRVDLCDLRRLTPISRSFGFERGLPIDRFYIEAFLERHSADVHGRVLEIGDAAYTHRFGGERVSCADVLGLRSDNPNATIVADLARADHLAADAFDCIIFTQTLQFIYDAAAAVSTLHRILRPGGVLLASFPVLSQICRYDMDRWGDYWRFTEASLRRLLQGVFEPAAIEVDSPGNVLAAICFLHGLAAEELKPAELAYRDPDYPLVVLARAAKGGALAADSQAGQDPRSRAR
jgi:SAM-dependent methyltransferase